MFLPLRPFSVPPPQPLARQPFAQTVVLRQGLFQSCDLTVDRTIARLDHEGTMALNLQKAVRSCIDIAAHIIAETLPARIFRSLGLAAHSEHHQTVF